jgi:flagellar biosynthesis protein FlhF
MLAALQEIQSEFGSDAIVLSMREVPFGPPWQLWRRQGFEVIAAPRSEKDLQTSPQLPPSGPASLSVTAVKTGAAAVVEKIPLPASTPEEMEARSSDVDPVQVKAFLPLEADDLASKRPEVAPALERIRRKLLSQGVNAAIIDQALVTCGKTVVPSARNDDVRLMAMVQRFLESGIKTLPMGALTPPSRVMCLAGPSGSGKTSACARLASLYLVTFGKKVVWVCADTVRTGAINEARTFAESIGVKLHLVYTPEEAGQTIAALPDADLILVDTPSFNPYKEDRVVDLAAFLTQVPSKSTYLVLAATMKESDLRQAVASFAPSSLKGLIVTKVDETSSFGNVYNLAHHSQLPLTYFTTGNSPVGNLRSANSADLIDALFRGRFKL